MAEITLTKAKKIVRAALAKADEMKLKPVAVAVLDAGGHLKAYERQDGASPGRFQIASGKAYGAVMLGIGGTAQYNRAESQAYFLLAANGAFDGRLVPVRGGVLVRSAKGEILGAVGISGDTSENDEACAVAGIEAAGYVAEP